jgi:hypothetical protein
MDPTWDRRPTSETAPAPTKKLNTNDTSEARSDTAVQLSRIEQLLDSILRSLAPLVGAR